MTFQKRHKTHTPWTLRFASRRFEFTKAIYRDLLSYCLPKVRLFQAEFCKKAYGETIWQAYN